MWPNREKEISDLTKRVAELELALERERSSRLADKLQVVGRMDSIQSDLLKSLADLRGKRAERPVPVARTGQQFREFAEAAEGVN